jgi:hypothetical protein
VSTSLDVLLRSRPWKVISRRQIIRANKWRAALRLLAAHATMIVAVGDLDSVATVEIVVRARRVAWRVLVSETLDGIRILCQSSQAHSAKAVWFLVDGSLSTRLIGKDAVECSGRLSPEIRGG